MYRKLTAIIVLLLAASCSAAATTAPVATTAPAVARIQTVPEASAKGELKTVYDKGLHDFNKVYNYQRLFSLRPDLLETVDRQYRLLMLAPGETTQRERVFVVGLVSLANGDKGFARLAEEFLSSMHGGPRPDLATGEYKSKALPARAEAILDFALKVNAAADKVTDPDVAALKAAGDRQEPPLTDTGVLEVTALVAFTKSINTASLALGLAAEPQNAGEGIVRGRSYDIPFERGDSHYDAIIAAGDGKVYFAVCTHHIDHHAQFFSFDPATKKVTHLADVGEIVGEKGHEAITQGKVHSYIFEHQGKLWFSTFKGYYDADLKGRKLYPGGHFVSYDLATGKFEDLAKVPEGEGIPTCRLDAKNGQFYGVTYPSGHLYVYDLASGKLECLERGKLNYGCAPTLDPDGRLYLTRGDGRLSRYDPRLPKEQAFQDLPVNTRNASWGPGEPGAVELLWDQKDGKQVYCLQYATSSIGLYNPEAPAFTPLARMSAGEKRKSQANFRGTSPGLLRAADGRFFHVTVGAPFADPPRPTLKYNCYLTSYDPKTNLSRNHGPVYFENDRRLYYNAAGTLSHDGESFVSIGWVEVNDPSRIEAVKQLRLESSPPEGGKGVYELRVIEVPLPK